MALLLLLWVLSQRRRAEFLRLRRVYFTPVIRLLGTVLRLRSILRLLLLGSRLFSGLFRRRRGLIFRVRILPVRVRFMSPRLGRCHLLRSCLPGLLLGLGRLSCQLLRSLRPLATMPLRFLSSSLRNFFFTGVPAQGERSVR